MPPTKPDTLSLKTFLKQNMREYVGHPRIDGEIVRVESVKRERWVMRYNGRAQNQWFDKTTDEEIRRITEGRPE